MFVLGGNMNERPEFHNMYDVIFFWDSYQNCVTVEERTMPHPSHRQSGAAKHAIQATPRYGDVV